MLEAGVSHTRDKMKKKTELFNIHGIRGLGSIIVAYVIYDIFIQPNSKF